MVCKLKDNKNNTCNDSIDILLTSSSGKQQKIHDDEYISIHDLRQTDIDILKILSDNEDENTIAIFSFNGLKIKLNLHQEILSRALRRLKELGLIEKNKYGYKSTKEGKITFSKLANVLNGNRTVQRKNTQILQIFVPFKIINQKLIENLSGKWYGNLRWIGMVQSITGYHFKWKDIESFIEIVVHISDHNIIIETIDNNPSNISKTFGYSIRILEWISDVVVKNNSLIYPINDEDFNRIIN